MRNRCGNFWGFFGILFVISGTFIASQMTPAQSNGTTSDPTPSQSNGTSRNVVPPQSNTVTIIKEIHASEKRILSEMHKLDKNVAVLKTRLDIIQWSLAIIGGPLIIFLATLGAQRLFKRDSRTERRSETTQPQRRKTDRDEYAYSKRSDSPQSIQKTA